VREHAGEQVVERLRYRSAPNGVLTFFHDLLALVGATKEHHLHLGVLSHLPLQFENVFEHAQVRLIDNQQLDLPKVDPCGALLLFAGLVVHGVA
jgi:hypothetical protein